MTANEKMDIHIQFSGMQNTGGLDALVQDNLRGLHLLVPISSAQVKLERQHAAAPAFSVSAHLAVPGPDIHATARDHTLTAAWRKLAGNLKKQFQRRMTQHQLRLKGRGQCRTVASQWNHGA
jgi:ribosome-associated translation inhibitor RaiA